MLTAFYVICFCVFLAFIAKVIEIIGEIEDSVHEKRIRRIKISDINDPIFDRIKYIHVTGLNRITREQYSAYYDVVSGIRDRGKWTDPCYSLFIDSSLFTNDDFSKDYVEFLDANKRKLDLSRHPYRVDVKPGEDCGFVVFYT